MASYEEYAARKQKEGKEPLPREKWEARVNRLQKAKEPKKEEPKAEKPAKAKAEKPKKAAKAEPKAEEPKKAAKPKKGLRGVFSAGPISRKEARHAANMLKPLLATIRHSGSTEATEALKEAHKGLTAYRRRQSFDFGALADNIRSGVAALGNTSDRAQAEAAKLLEILDGLEAELKKR